MKWHEEERHPGGPRREAQRGLLPLKDVPFSPSAVGAPRVILR